MNRLQMAKEITSIMGVSGYEKNISTFLCEQFQPYADEIIYDHLGSIYAVKKSNKKDAMRVMIHSHMDELGAIIVKLNENGTMWALPLGKIEENSLLGQKIQLVNSQQSYFFGTILGENSKNQVLNNQKQFLVDIGASSLSELEKMKIEPGNIVTFNQEFFVNHNGERWFARNWNGRFGVLALIEILKNIHEMTFPFDLYIGCSVQEQVGLRGVQTATNLVKPDFALVLDTQQAFDYRQDGDKENGRLGEGILLTYYDKSVLPSRKALYDLKELCIEHHIPHQFYYSMEDSDAGWINKLRQGAPILFFNIAVRNMNTPNQEIAVRDYDSILNAVKIFLTHLTLDKIKDYKQVNE